MTESTKLCPFCAEPIQAAAIKCKHCGEFLDKEPPKTAPKTPMDQYKRVRNIGALVVILGTFALLFFAGYGAKVSPRCKLFPAGNGTCEFVNTGLGPGSGCLQVSYVRGGKRYTDLIHSGYLWPGAAATRRVVVAIPSQFCKAPPGKSWRDVCRMVIEKVKCR